MSTGPGETDDEQSGMEITKHFCTFSFERNAHSKRYPTRRLRQPTAQHRLCTAESRVVRD